MSAALSFSVILQGTEEAHGAFYSFIWVRLIVCSFCARPGVPLIRREALCWFLDGPSFWLFSSSPILPGLLPIQALFGKCGGETLGGDRYAVMFWSGLAYLLILGPLFALICILVKSKLKHPALGLLFYPLFCSLSFIVPTAFIFLFNGGGSLLSAEAQLFYSFFAASGLTFGLGYGIISIIWRPKPPMQNESLEHVQ